MMMGLAGRGGGGEAAAGGDHSRSGSSVPMVGGLDLSSGGSSLEVESRDGGSRAWGELKWRRKHMWWLATGIMMCAVACAVAGISSVEIGWARYQRKDFRPQKNTLVGIVDLIIENNPDIIQEFAAISLIKPLLPHKNIDVDLRLGWMKRGINIHFHDIELPSFILSALDSPRLDTHRGLIDDFVENQEFKQTRLFKDNRVGGQVSGAIVMSTQSISVLLAISFFVLGLISTRNKFTKCGHSCRGACNYIAEYALIMGILLFLTGVAHYIALAVGAEHETRTHPIFGQGFIPHPSYAFFLDIIASLCWMAIGILYRRGLIQFDVEISEIPEESGKKLSPPEKHV